MSKSRKKPDSEVDSDPAVVASPATLIENEKQVVGSKKQKIDNGDKEQAFEKKNFGKETEENTNEEQNNFTEESKVEVSPAIKSAETTQDANKARITNDYEEEGEDNSKEDKKHLKTPMESVEVPPAIKPTPTTKDTKRARISNDYEEEDEDDNSKENHHHLETPMESVDVPPAIKSGPTTQDAKRARISNKSEEEDGYDRSKENHHHLETPKNSVEVPPAINCAETTQDSNRATISSEYEEEDRDDNSKKSGTDVEMLDASSLKKTDQTPLSSQAPGSKTVLMDNLSCSIQEKDVKKFFKDAGEIAEIHFEMKEGYFTGHGHVEFTTAEAAQEALKLSNTSLLNRPVKLNLATERGEHPTTTPHATGSKTLFLGNLSFAIEEDDVRDFFKDVGEIASIRFAIKNDRFLGHGYVEFTTAEAAQEALKLNLKVILDRKVKLDLARERGVYTPGSSFEKSNQRGGHAQGRTIYVRGFDYSHGFDNIRSILEKHFGKCGEITRIHVPQDYESGAPRGSAFIDFADSNAFSEALRLDNSEIGGCTIIVEEAKKKRGEGFGYGRDSGSGGGESGSGSGWGRGNDCGGGSSRPSGGDAGSSSKGILGRASGDQSGGGSGRASGGWPREGGWRGEGGSSSRGTLGRTSDYGGDWSGGTSGRASGGRHREGGSSFRGIMGRASGYGGDWSGGGRFNSSRVGRFSGGYGGSRGGGGSRP